jgi:hypothetical protein
VQISNAVNHDDVYCENACNPTSHPELPEKVEAYNGRGYNDDQYLKQ